MAFLSGVRPINVATVNSAQMLKVTLIGLGGSRPLTVATVNSTQMLKVTLIGLEGLRLALNMSVQCPFLGQCEAFARCSVFDRNLQSRMPLSFTPLLRLQRCHACDQWHSSRVFPPLTGWHYKLRLNTAGCDDCP
jgi:hypothetical protein